MRLIRAIADGSRPLLSHFRRFSSASRTLNKNFRDSVLIRELELHARIGTDCWNRPTVQKCKVNLEMTTDFSRASREDELKHSLNYAVVCRELGRHVAGRSDWQSITNLGRELSEFVMNKWPAIDHLSLQTTSNTIHLRANDVSCIIVRGKTNLGRPDCIRIQNLELLTIIGVYSFERFQRQFVSLDIEIPWKENSEGTVPIVKLIDKITDFVEQSNFKTVEALVESVARVIVTIPYFEGYEPYTITVRVLKLNAITETKGVGVQCTRSIKYLRSKKLIEHEAQITNFNLPTQNLKIEGGKSNTAYIAFGSNVGDRFEAIENALHIMGSHNDVEIKRTSSLFESQPMYFKDQNTFINGIFEIETSLKPKELLKLCKDIEYNHLKRVKDFDNGPRSIDLDIILYLDSNKNHVQMNERSLTIPHPRMLERTFVMEPLCELIQPNAVHPVTAESYHDHLSHIYQQNNDEDTLIKVVTTAHQGFLKFCKRSNSNSKTNNNTPTLIMGVINTTPDSFSDGGKSFDNLATQLEEVRKLCDSALKLHQTVIIDIGGCSTRPNSPQIDKDEEIRRTIHLIHSIRKDERLPHDRIFISIDTYRSEVAKKALDAGADIVNDISGGLFDDKMFKVIANYPRAAYILSHIRGDIKTMSSLTKYEDEYNASYEEYINGEPCRTPETELIRAVAREISHRYLRAAKEGVRRWQIILDPGLGFAKNLEQNIELIRQLKTLEGYSIYHDGSYVSFQNLPILIGPSRKRFIGEITKEPNPSDRDIATGSVITAGIGLGADIVRVHNVNEMAKVVKISDAIYKELF